MGRIIIDDDLHDSLSYGCVCSVSVIKPCHVAAVAVAVVQGNHTLDASWV